jgi:hypothetical protein
MKLFMSINKVNLSLGLIKYAPRNEDTWKKWRYGSTSALYGVEWSFHSPAALRGKQPPVNRARLNIMEKTEISCPYRELNPDSLA